MMAVVMKDAMMILRMVIFLLVEGHQYAPDCPARLSPGVNRGQRRHRRRPTEGGVARGGEYSRPPVNPAP
jgi:hypothetical protein